jgi:hypothetical protein
MEVRADISTLRAASRSSQPRRAKGAKSAVRFRQQRFHETAGYPESAHGTRGTAQPVVIFCRQIQQASLREMICIFSKAAAPSCLLFQKGAVHLVTRKKQQTR